MTRKTVFVVAVATLFLPCYLCSTAKAGGTTVSDNELNITLTIPDEFEPVPGFKSPEEFDIRYAFMRVNADGKPDTGIFIERMPGTIGRKQIDEQQARKFGAAGLYREKWKSFDVNVFLVKEQMDGMTFITRNIQVPIKPRAIQLKVFGPESQDAELADLTRKLLASLDGPTNFLTDAERGERLGEGIARLLFWMIGIGAVIYGLVIWRTRAFRSQAIGKGILMEVAMQKIRPGWAWYLLGAYVLLGSIFAGLWMFVVDFRGLVDGHNIYMRGLSVIVPGFVVASAIIGIVMWRRILAKRKILAALPPPLPPGGQ